ncbi:MAG: type II toxin-antitoxin system VapC family toxin [Verrucomicrobiales bacterium]
MILLDTCILLWLASDSDEISDIAAGAIRRHAGELAVSAISAWEIGIKSAKGHLELLLPVDAWFQRACDRHGVRPISIDHHQAVASTCLPRIHADPADRMIIALAIEKNIPVVTPDTHFSEYPGLQVIW